MDNLSDFTRFEFTHAGAQKSVHRQGEGPAVVVRHDLMFFRDRLAPGSRNPPGPAPA